MKGYKKRVQNCTLYVCSDGNIPILNTALFEETLKQKLWLLLFPRMQISKSQ